VSTLFIFKISSSNQQSMSQKEPAAGCLAKLIAWAAQAR
jgi:hypothetical protein